MRRLSTKRAPRKENELGDEEYTIDDFFVDFLPNDSEAAIDDTWLPSWAQQD